MLPQTTSQTSLGRTAGKSPLTYTRIHGNNALTHTPEAPDPKATTVIRRASSPCEERRRRMMGKGPAKEEKNTWEITIPVAVLTRIRVARFADAQQTLAYSVDYRILTRRIPSFTVN
ncbi:hypothetical protein CLAFUW4_00352 [Fulvia fulva]|nr:hypothetical protein CLAFUR4_00352 [Fulvia fulva]WPV09220.1 hypothetical protein CLAFUW4_00352 [Fulvia fulva]WPV24327.1 hypothetical protein CLAFUW7_00356 [Fulvia fulva]